MKIKTKTASVHPAAHAPFKLPSSLLNVDGNAKTVKGQSAGYLTGILYLAPATLAGVTVGAPTSGASVATCSSTTLSAPAFPLTFSARPLRPRADLLDRSDLGPPLDLRRSPFTFGAPLRRSA